MTHGSLNTYEYLQVNSREKAAGNPNTPAEVLETLAKDE